MSRVHILHTNDLHSHFESMPSIHTLLHRLSEQLEGEGEKVFRVDLGDHMDRFSLETEGTLGRANRAVMDFTGYELVTLGNNELLTFSKKELHDLYEKAPFDVLALNVEEEDGQRPPWIKPWEIRDVDGFRIGFLGVTIPFPQFYELLGWQVSDPFEVLPRAVSHLRKDVHAVVILSHLGLGNDRRLAEVVPGIDVILGSHTHHLLEVPERVGNTLITGAGKFGGHVGHVMLDFDPVQHRVTAREARCLPVADVDPDPRLKARISLFRREAEEYLSEAIRELNHPLPVDWYAESPLGNFLADGLLQWVPDSDCALVNAGQLLGGLQAGPVTREHLHRICPHPINPVQLVLTGRQIRGILEDSLIRDRQEREIRGFGFRGKKLGMMNLAGMEAEVNPLKPPGQRLGRVQINGALLEKDRDYRVATIDMFTFGAGYGEFKKGREKKYFLPEFLRDVLAHHLRQSGAPERSFRPRWRDPG
ncbi:5'-nucleotidase [Desmospora sp. 8437]|nr:5'-nucleotidase [Desmospora sp. 8437]